MIRRESWHTEYHCTARDLGRIEEHDLEPLRRQNAAWLLSDSRDSFWTEPDLVRYSRKWCVFLASGIWWAVPSVTIRLDYDWVRGTGLIDMRTRDVARLWASYFPEGESRTVEGLERILYRPLPAP